MRKDHKEAILNYITAIDPQGKVVKIKLTPDLENGKISFGDLITQHRYERKLQSEKWVEVYLIAKLVYELGYPVSSLELQKEYPAGHPKTTKPRIDIVVRDDRQEISKTFMIIEAKVPEEFESQKVGIEGQLFGLGDHERPRGLKYMVYYTVEFIGGVLLDKTVIIDAEQFSTFEHWNSEGRPSLDQLPIGYAAATKSFYVNKLDTDLLPSEKNLNKRVGRNEFTALRRDLHNVLWGGGGTPDNDVFSNLVKLFLAKIYDEEFTPEGQAYGFQIIVKDGKPQPASEVVTKLNSKNKLHNGQYEGILRRAQKEYLEMSDEEILISQGLDLEKISPGKIAYVVEQIQGISLTENENKDNSDILGEFFEGIVRAGFKQSKGQFFTHTNIVKFCIYSLKIDDLVEEKINKENTLPSIIDPACGSGTFPIEAMKSVTWTVKHRELATKVHKRAQQLIASWFPPLKENIWARDFIYGIEINPDLALATKVNMVLHGDGNINILIRDGLLDFEKYEISKKVSALAKKTVKHGFPYSFPVNEQFDVLISNPPFSVDLDTETKRGLPSRFEFADKRNSENLFIERWYQLLKPGGRMAVVLPEAVFDTGENDYIRLFLFKYFSIKAVVSLPELAFKPWTPTRTSLLFATKKTDEEVRAYEEFWREKTKEFYKLLQSPPISYVLRGDKLISLSNRLCSQYDSRIPIKETVIETVKSIKGLLSTLKENPELNSGDKERADRYIRDLENWLAIDPNSTWPIKESRSQIKQFLKSFFDEQYDEKMTIEQIERHWEEILGVAKSSWWVFTEVSKDFDEEILYYEIENIGYKRTANRERPAPNELFKLDQQGKINLIDDDTVLGKIRSKVKY